LKFLYRVALALIGPYPKPDDSHNALAKDLEMAPFVLVSADFSKDRGGLLLGWNSSVFLDWSVFLGFFELFDLKKEEMWPFETSVNF
jgi:hypothetical protein